MQSISCTFPLIFLDSGWLFIIFLHFRHFFHLGGNVFLYLWQTVCEIAHKLCEIAHCFATSKMLIALNMNILQVWHGFCR